MKSSRILSIFGDVRVSGTVHPKTQQKWSCFWLLRNLGLQILRNDPYVSFCFLQKI